MALTTRMIGRCSLEMAKDRTETVFLSCLCDFSAKIMKICDSHNNFPIFSSVLCFIYTLNMITYWNTGNYLVYRRLFLSVIYTLIRIIWAIFIIFLYLTFWYTDCFIITKYFGTLCFCLWNTLFLSLKQSVPSVETMLEHFYNL